MHIAQNLLQRSRLPSHRTSLGRRLGALVSTLPLAATLLLIAPTASAQASTTVDQWTFYERVVSGSGWSEPNACLVREDTVGAGVFVKGEPAQVLVTRFEYDRCIGQSSYVRGTAPASVFKVPGDLSSAHVVATIPLFDGSTGESAGSVLVDEVWTATSTLAITSLHTTRIEPGGLLYENSFQGKAREAAVSGSIPLNLGGHLVISKGFAVTVSHS